MASIDGLLLPIPAADGPLKADLSTPVDNFTLDLLTGDPMARWAGAHIVRKAHRLDAFYARAIATGTPDTVAAAHRQMVAGHLTRGHAGRAAENARALLDMDPTNDGNAVRLASCLLTDGRYSEAWPFWERRAGLPAFPFASLPDDRQWRGGQLPTTLLVHCPDGDGDAIMMARYASVLARRGCRPTFAAAERLLPVLRDVEGMAGVLDIAGPLPHCGQWVDRLSLPALLNTTLRTIPHPSGYIAADSRKATLREWRHGRRDGAFRVGLCWASSDRHATPLWRSMQPAYLKPVFKVEGVEFVNLQVGARNSEGAAIGIAENPAAAFRDYGDTAGAIADLDLVISVDTSVAHLAGAMGVPVFVMLPIPADWRWLAGREDCPWYGSARLFRQSRPMDWTKPAAEAAKALRKVVRAAASRGRVVESRQPSAATLPPVGCWKAAGDSLTSRVGMVRAGPSLASFGVGEGVAA